MMHLPQKLFLSCLAAIFVCITFVQTTRALDNVGIFFDQSGTITCIADSLYTPMRAYLLIKHPSNSTGISGWEGRLSADEGIFLSPIAITGSGPNISGFPEYSIGLVQPLPHSDVTILATFSVYATRPGGVYFGATAHPSLPEVTTGIYAAGDNPGLLIPMQCPNEDCAVPLATVSESECTGSDALQGEEQELATLPISEARDVSFVEQPSRLIIQEQDLADTLTTRNLKDLLYRSHFACIGVVEDIAYRCLARPTMRQASPYSYALARVRPTRSYWGVTSETITILMPCAHVENCVDTRNSPYFKTYDVGSTYFFVGRWEGDVYETYPLGVLSLRGDSLWTNAAAAVSLEGLSECAAEIAVTRDLGNSYASANAVVLASIDAVVREADGGILARWSNIEVLKGEVPGDYVRVPRGQPELAPDGRISIPPTLRVGYRYLLLLRYGVDGTAVLWNGCWGAFCLEGKALRSGVGALVGSMDTVDALRQ